MMMANSKNAILCKPFDAEAILQSQYLYSSVQQYTVYMKRESGHMQRQKCGQGGGSLILLLVLLGGCIVQQQVECKHDHGDYDFDPIINGLPPGFVIGTASAAYQASSERLH